MRRPVWTKTKFSDRRDVARRASHKRCSAMSRSEASDKPTARYAPPVQRHEEERKRRRERAKRAMSLNVSAYLKLRSNLGGGSPKANRNHICRVIGCIALLGDSLLAISQNTKCF